MSNHLISATYKRALGTGTRKAVMVLMADKASDDGRGIYASKKTMADELDLSKQTVISTIKSLIADDLLVEIGERRCDTGHTVEYAINVDVLFAMPRVRYEQKRAEKAKNRKRPSPVKDFDRSTDLTPSGQVALPKPLLKPNSPQTPQTESDQIPDRDPGDEPWRIPPGRSWKETGAMLRQLNKPKREARRQRGAKQTQQPDAKPVERKPVAAQQREDERSQELRSCLKRTLGDQTFNHWFANAALIVDQAEVTVIAASPFQSTWMEQNFRGHIFSAARRFFNDAPSKISFQTGPCQHIGASQ